MAESGFSTKALIAAAELSSIGSPLRIYPNPVSALVGTGQWKIDLMHDVFAKLIGIGTSCTNGEQTGKEHKIDKTFMDLLKGVVAEKDSLRC